MHTQNIVIVGGGAAALMLGCTLNSSKYNIHIYEKNASLGRKFLVAGKGGFNLTHAEPIAAFIQRYSPSSFIAPYINAFTPTNFSTWLSTIGIETYVGTSKRVFPTQGTKPIQVLKAIKNTLINNHVTIHYKHTWLGFGSNDNELLFVHNGNTITVTPHIVVFALGGASWSVTGSDGSWASYFANKNIVVEPFYPSNCAYAVNWESVLAERIAGQPLKNCVFSSGDVHKKGEAVLTRFGIEGSGVYALGAAVRAQLVVSNTATLYVDFKPECNLNYITYCITSRGNLSMKDVLLKKLKLTTAQLYLLQNKTTKVQYANATILSTLIKNYPITIVGCAPINEAISSVGGIALHEVTETLALKKLPNHYAMGEMLNWDAPTGGYLLQACFSMGKTLGDTLNSI